MNRIPGQEEQREAKEFLVELREVDNQLDRVKQDVDILRVHIQEITGAIVLDERCAGCGIRFMAYEWDTRYSYQENNYHPDCYRQLSGMMPGQEIE